MKADPIKSQKRMPIKVESSPILPGLSSVCGRSIVARFDNGTMSSDGGLLALREIEQRLAIAPRLAAVIPDPRSPDRVMHGLGEIIRTRMLTDIEASPADRQMVCWTTISNNHKLIGVWRSTTISTPDELYGLAHSMSLNKIYL